jgi:PIN domain nuclease of toxin-antitoxin system
MAMEHGYQCLALEAVVAASFHQLPAVVAHRDPFDRMLVWQAIRGGLTLVSHDHAMAAYAPHGLSLLW